MIREDVVTIEETSFCEEGISSQNQVAIPNTNDSVVRVLESSYSSSSSEEEDDDGSRQLAQIRPQSHTDNGVKIFNRYSGCRNVSSTVNNTNVYKDGVTVNHNCYCCPASIDFVCKSCVTRRGALFVIIVLLGISLLISLSVRLTNLNSSKRTNYLEDETFLISSTTRKLPKSRIFTTPKTTKPSKTVYQATAELNLTANPGWKIISRDEWGAALPNSDLYIGKLVIFPPLYVILSETKTDTCITTEKCMKIVRDIQASDMGNFSKPDIKYSFLVGGDGMVYEGRGWDVQAVGDYDTKLFDRISISISLIGNFEDAVPTEIILQAAKTLLEFGVQAGKLDEDYTLKCARQLSYMSKNPGDKLYNIIKMWKGWDNRTIEEILLLVEGDESY